MDDFLNDVKQYGVLLFTDMFNLYAFMYTLDICAKIFNSSYSKENFIVCFV